MQPDLSAAILEAEADEEEFTGSFILQGIPWIVYRMLRALDGRRNVRMSYLDGTLYLISPEFIHEHGTSNLAQLVISVARGLGQELEPAGATTLRRKGRGGRRGAGKEPDASFYIGRNAEVMRAKDSIRLAIDPPPDLAIEVDNKADSSAALKIYSRLRVPELWRYKPRKRSLWFGGLDGTRYRSLEGSLAFPMLTPALMLQALNVRASGELGFMAWGDWVSKWARALPVLLPGS
jgi:Uma2 family endonuclease